MSDDTPSLLNNVITIDDERIRSHLERVVRGTVEETLNALLDAEADRLCNAQRYERSASRRDTRAGHYERGLQTKAGEVRLRVPKLRRQTLETAIIERYRRRESSVEEALIEMYLAGVSVRRVEDITEALWGTRVSPSTVSALNKKIYGTIEAWRNRPIEGEHPYVYLDGIVLKRSWAGEVRNVSLLVAIGVNESGYREILGICEGAKEDKTGWSAFLKHLKESGLKGIRLITSDACIGLAESAAEFFPEAAWQRCVVHWYRNIFSHVPSTKVREIAAMLKAIHAGGGHRGSAREGHPSNREAAWTAPEPRRRTGGNGGRGDARLLRLPGGALAADSHQQPARAHSARGPAAHPPRGRVP
jgi:putative transposase